jgi:molybdopterin molybdotransferase
MSGASSLLDPTQQGAACRYTEYAVDFAVRLAVELQSARGNCFRKELMTQLSKDLFVAGSGLMPVEEAVDRLSRLPAVKETETVGLFDADGRILAQDLVATVDLPPFDNSAVDGYAVRFADLNPGAESKLELAGRVAAGQVPVASPRSRTVMRIFTGAPMPAGFDSVFMQEDCRLCDDGKVILPPGLRAGANRRRQGEDLAKGAKALAKGRRLAPEDIGLAAALGQDRLVVRRRLNVAIFSTGDEIVSPGRQLPYAGVYDANRFMLASLLRRQGANVTDLGILADDRDAIAQALSKAAREHDLVITSGGVSIGEEDHVKAALHQNGSLVFWRLAIKPGRPVAMGIIEGTPFVGLPGNPAAVFITFIHILRPLIAALSGAFLEPPHMFDVVAGFAFQKKPGRREYIRASLAKDPQGLTVAVKHPMEGSGILTSLTRTTGLLELREAVTSIKPGDLLSYLDYGLIR